MYTAIDSSSNSWNNTHLANSIWEFDNILIKIVGTVVVSSNNLPKSIKNCMTYIKEITQVSDLLKYVKSTKAIKIGTKKDGGLI